MLLYFQYSLISGKGETLSICRFVCILLHSTRVSVCSLAAVSLIWQFPMLFLFVQWLQQAVYKLTVRSSPCTGSLQYNQKVEDRNGAGHRSNSIYRGAVDKQFQFVSGFMPRALPTILIPHFFLIYFIAETGLLLKLEESPTGRRNFTLKPRLTTLCSGNRICVAYQTLKYEIVHFS